MVQYTKKDQWKIMRTKSFKKYIEKRLDKDEIKEIERQAELEIRILESLQHLISDTE